MNTPPRAAPRAATGWTLPQAPVNLMRNFTLENIRRAIEGGRDINKQDDDGSTLLMEAVARGKDDIVGYLLDNGADVNIQDENGETALWYYRNAMYKAEDLEKIVQMLLETGTWFLPNINGKMVIDMAEDLYNEAALEQARRDNNSPYSDISYGYGNNSPNFGALTAARVAAANLAWRASVGLPASEGEYPPAMRRAKNIRDLIKLYTDQFVRQVKLGSIAASANTDATIIVDVRMSVYQLKKYIQYIFNIDFKFELVYPSFHLAGKKTMDDDRTLADYGIRNGIRLILSPRVESGRRIGGTRRVRRRNKKTRSRSRRN